MLKLFLTVALLGTVSLVLGANYPESLPRCKAGDIDCLPDVITDTIKKAVKGLPEINLAPLDPLHIDSMRILQGKESPVNVELKFKNFTLSGFSKMQFVKVVGFDKDPKTSSFELYAKAPGSIILNGPYSIKGQVLILPIFGNGQSKIEITNSNLTIKFNGKVENINGEEHMQVENLKLNFEPTKVKTHFNNLFNGDKLLGDTTNRFMNENWEDIFKEIKPGFTTALEKVAKDIINGVFKKIPYNEAFIA